MIPRAAWDAPFRNGLGSLQDGSYDEALRSFDEAVRAAGDTTRVFKSRKEVLETLRMLEMSFRSDDNPDAKTDESDDEANQATERRLFSLLERLPPQFRTFVLSLSPGLKPPAITPSYLLIADERLTLLKQSRDLTCYLPPELLVLIGRFVVRSSSPWSAGKGFALAGVCKRWRSIFIQDKELWEDVKIRGSSSTAIEKAETLVARGRLRFLSIWVTEQMEDLSSVYTLLEGRGSDLRILQASLGQGTDLDDVWRILFNPSGSPRLTSLRVSRWCLPSSLLHLPPAILPNLTSFEFRHPAFYSETSLYPFLRLLPNLETIVLTGGFNFHLGDGSNDGMKVLELPLLKSFSLTEYRGSALHPSVYLVAPLLVKLDLARSKHQSHHNFLFPPSPHQPNTTHLTTLILGDSYSLSDWNELDLLADLKQMPSLTYLSVANSPISDAFINGLQGGGDENRIVCSLLSSLHLGAQHFSWEAVGRMVMARWDEDDDGDRTRGIRRITYRREGGHEYGGGEEMDTSMYELLKDYLEVLENV